MPPSRCDTDPCCWHWKALLTHNLASAATENANAARNARWLQHFGVERGNAARVFKGERFVEA